METRGWLAYPAISRQRLSDYREAGGRTSEFSASLAYHMVAKLSFTDYETNRCRFFFTSLCAMSLRRHEPYEAISHMFRHENCVGLFIKISIRRGQTELCLSRFSMPKTSEFRESLTSLSE